MIIVLIIIFIALIIAGIIAYNKASYDSNWEVGGPILSIISGILLLVCLICGLFLINDVVSLRIIDEKIVMYQEENQVIETQISEAVKQYQKHEQDIFTEVSPESSIVLVTTYPELKSDALVQKQLEVYISNNEKIKELKQSKINGKIYKWWLYFG